MVNKRTSLFGKLGALFTRYPKKPGVNPDAFTEVVLTRQGQCSEADAGTVAMQSVPDSFYFLLFGAIRAYLKGGLHGRAELVVVRAVSGAVGTGWLAGLKRAAPSNWLWSQQWVRAYGGHVDGVAYRCSTWAHPFSDLADWVRAGRLWKQLQQQGEGRTLNVGGIEVADLVVDSYLRFKPSPVFDVSDPFVRRLIWQALRDVRAAHAYFGRVKPRLYLTSYSTYLEHGIPARVALLHGVQVWSFGNLNRFGKKLTLGDSYHTQDFSGYRRGFESLDQQTERLQQAREQLESRLSGGIDAATSYMRQSAYSRATVELPAGLAGSVVIFLHDFYDSPHIYPDLVFDDFWSWICFTIEELRQMGATFFLKPHPNQIALSDEALERLRGGYPDLKWLPSGVSNVQLAQAGIACGITVYGTVAHELAYLGVPSIGCARHPHHTFDFCRTARTKQGYADLLKSYGEIPLPKVEMQDQALAFYYMHNLYGAADELALKQAFVALWRACNLEADDGGEGMMAAFRELARLPAFARFVAAIQKIPASAL